MIRTHNPGWMGLLLIALLPPHPLAAQKEKREPLTEAQIEKIREAGIYPVQRLTLYSGFVDEHAAHLRQLAGRAPSEARSKYMEEALEDLTALMDELGSNLDQYSDRKADIRKALKTISEAAPRWLALLHGITAEEGFELSRKEAIESADDLNEQAKRLLTEQTEYFRTHKDEQGQDRVEPRE